MSIITKALLIDKDHNYPNGYKSIKEHEDELIDISEFADGEAISDATMTGTFGHIIKNDLVYHLVKCFWDYDKKIRYFIAKCEYQAYDDVTPQPEPPEPDPPQPTPEETMAMVNGKRYKTVEEAIAAAISEGGTVRLTQDATMTGTTIITKGNSVAINLCGNALICDKPQARCLFNNGTLRISNGTIRNTSEASYGLIDNSKNTAATLILENVTLEDHGGDDGSTVVDRGNGSMTLINCNIKSLSEGTMANACVMANMNSKVTLENCKITSNSGKNGGGIYAVVCRGGEVTANGCQIDSAKGGFAVDHGTAVINDCVIKTDIFYAIWITNDGEHTNVTVNGSIFSGKLYGLYASIDDNEKDYCDVDITINGGQFFGQRGAIGLNTTGSERKWNFAVNGGIYCSDVSMYLDENHEQLPNGAVVKK